MTFELFWRFLIVGSLAFGGGQAALPLLEQLTVADTEWLSPGEFSTGVGLAYATPGPVLVLAPFVGYHVQGLRGAVVAAIGVFLVPVLLAGAAARFVERFRTSKRFRDFGRFAAASAIGLLGVTLFTIGRPVYEMHPALLFVAFMICVAEIKGAPPILLLVVAIASGAVTARLVG